MVCIRVSGSGFRVEGLEVMGGWPHDEFYLHTACRPKSSKRIIPDVPGNSILVVRAAPSLRAYNSIYCFCPHVIEVLV